MRKEHPILFSTPMVKAILSGNKTMSRRIIKIQPDENGITYMKNAPLDWPYDEEWKPWIYDTDEGERIAIHCPYGEPCDILWVRESWRLNTGGYLYRADYNETKGITPGGIWKPSIHMPKAACRILLEITNVRVERLQDISEEDAIAEGINQEVTGDDLYQNYLKGGFRWVKAKDSFKSLWIMINGEESWNNNPWVWVIEFKRIEKQNL